MLQKLHIPKAIIALFLLGCLTPPAKALIIQYNVTLNGLNESPANASPGVGSGQVTYDNVAHTMRVQCTFSGLTGLANVGHIHAPTAVAGTGTASVAIGSDTFPLGVTSGSYDKTFDMTLASSYTPSYVTANGGTPASAEAALTTSMAAGKAYLDIHTSTFPSGEIRDFLSANYSLTVITNGNGTITPGSGTYTPGTNVNLTARPMRATRSPAGQATLPAPTTLSA